MLSWNVPPSSTDPDAVPFWGNRLDVHVQAPVASPGAGTGPNIFAIGGIGVASIDSFYDPITQTTSGGGLTVPGAHFAFTGALTDFRACPFGGEVVINGEPVPGGSYRIQVRNLSQGTGWTTLVNPVTVVDSNGILGNNTPIGEYYPYLNHLSNEFGALADWFTTSTTCGRSSSTRATLRTIRSGRFATTFSSTTRLPSPTSTSTAAVTARSSPSA